MPREKILIVDDEPSILDFAMDALDKEGYMPKANWAKEPPSSWNYLSASSDRERAAK